MKTYLLALLLVFISMSACLKTSIEQETENPSGKWVSIAFASDEGAWITDITPHYWDFKADYTFTFRDHNGSECGGEFDLVTPINSYTQFDFKNQNCGLTSRVIDHYEPDTLILRVISPPNITKEKVKYKRVQ